MNKNILLFVIVLLAGYAMTVFGSQSSKADDQWIYLFDGTTTEGWREYNGESLPSKWTIKDSVLTFDTNLQLEKDMKGGGDIIYYLEEFENFELYLEWKLPEGGNSGVFYHLKEGFNTPYEVGPEYQLLDDYGWEKIDNATLEEWQKAGADYAMYSPNNNKTINSAGKWNTSKIIFTPEKVEHWINGEKILSFVPWSEDWYNRKSKSKWKVNSDNIISIISTIINSCLTTRPTIIWIYFNPIIYRR